MRELFSQVLIPLDSQSPHETPFDKRTIWIKLLFESLHQIKIRARLTPHAGEAFQINGTAFYDQSATRLLCIETKLSNRFYEARRCISWSQFNIQDTIAGMRHDRRFKLVTPADLLNPLEIRGYLRHHYSHFTGYIPLCMFAHD